MFGRHLLVLRREDPLCSGGHLHEKIQLYRIRGDAAVIKTKGETNMGEENRSLLEEEIKAEIKRLGSLESGSQEHTTAVDSLTKLYKLKLEEDKNTYERLDKIENREIDQESKTAQMAESVKDRYFRFGMAAAELVLPLMFYGVWMRRGLKFEQDGTFTSQTFRGLFSRFRPTKK